MASGTLDSILNVLMPVIIIGTVFGFVWIKFMEPYFKPMLIKLWDSITGANMIRRQKTIEYD